MSATAVVVIGRNEGERLRRCFLSVCGPGTTVVYVDSGSTDDSLATARAMGVDVVELDMRIPFTAARARNDGWRRVQAIAAGADVVQFVDGDCELWPDWPALASTPGDRNVNRSCSSCSQYQSADKLVSLRNRISL